MANSSEVRRRRGARLDGTRTALRERRDARGGIRAAHTRARKESADA
jgi:hypothetical protein